MQNILITGSAGFIGGKLFNYLKKKNLNVYGVDCDIFNKINDKIFDINLLNYEDTKNFLLRVKPHFIFHFAGFSGPERNEKKPEFAYTYNVELLKNILKNLDNSIPIFFPQTDRIFDGLTFPNERTSVNLTSVHAKVKFECENMLKKHTNKHFIFRQPVVHSVGGYVPNSKMAGHGSFIDQAIDKIKLNKKVEAFSNIERCFLRVEELVQIYEKLLSSEDYGTYNLASPMTSYYARLSHLCKENHIKFDKFLTPTTGDIFPLKKNIDNSKFEKTFNFKMS